MRDEGLGEGSEDEEVPEDEGWGWRHGSCGMGMLGMQDGGRGGCGMGTGGQVVPVPFLQM